jgi:exoribonuclease R
MEFLKTIVINNISYSYESIHESQYADVLGRISKCLGCDSSDSHEWIAQLMIFYNIEAAKVLKAKGQGILRTHAPPDVEKLEKFKSIGVDVQFLAFKSAKYVPATSTDIHWGLNTDVYCHVTSPIRRFADIVNQFVLKNEEPPEVDIELLNVRTKEIKQYSRDVFFLYQLKTTTRNVSAVTLNDHRIWVPEWKRIITCKNTEPEGTQGTLYFSLDMNQSSWKRRMVFKFVNTANQE